MQLKTLAVPFVAVNAVATLAQLFLGADLVVLVTLALISFSGLVPILNNRPQLSDFLFIAFTLYYGCLGLILKTLLLQPVDSNLYEPTLSSLYLLAGFGSMFMGYIALRMFTRSTEGGWGQFDSWFRNEDFLRTWVRPAFALGLLSMALSALFRTQLAPGSAVVVEEGFGGFSTFNFLVECSIAGQLYLSTRPRRPRADAIEAAVMGSAIFVLAILGNIKQPLVVLMIVICVTLLTTTGFKVKVSRLIYLGIAASMFVFFINPLIHISRDQLYGKSVVARLSLAVEILQRAQFDPWTLADQASEVLRRHSFTPSATYFYPSTANLDRFAMIMPVDQVVRALPGSGRWG